MTIMPWGKHKGHHISKIPASYLFWVLEECNSVTPMLKIHIEDELRRRLPSKCSENRNEAAAVDKKYLNEWCRRASVACHPDLGGNIDAMKLVNELRFKIQG